jgi:hypothetical protein
MPQNVKGVKPDLTGTGIRWEPDEEKLMLKIVKGGEKDWKIVAQKLGTERKAASVRQRWNLLNRVPRSSTGIAKKKGAAPTKGKAIAKSNTKRIRTKTSSLALRLNKGQPRAIFTGKGIRWEAKEELQLRQLVESGEKDWDLIAKKLGTSRKSPSVRQRYNLLNRVPRDAAKRAAKGHPRESYAVVEAAVREWKELKSVVEDTISDAPVAAKAKPTKRSTRSSK